MNMSLIDISLNETDRRLLIVLLIVLILFFVLLGLLGMLIRWISIEFAKRMDYELHDVVVYRVIQDPRSLRKYGLIKNNRVLFKQAIAPFIIAFVSLILYLVYSSVTGQWAEDHFTEFSTLFFNFNWSDPKIYANFWGMTLLTRWPDWIPSAGPMWVSDFWASYLLVPMWLVSAVYFAVDIQAFVARLVMLERRCRTVFNKSLDGYNYYDTVSINSPGQKENEASKQQRQQ
jgi:hypothetical protein